MLRPLLQGQTLAVIPDNVIYDPSLLTDFISSMNVKRMLFTPSLLEAVLDTKALSASALKEKLSSITCVTLCGEVVTVALQERAKEFFPNASLWNLYSVSECHDVAAVDLASKSFTGRKYCPVGKLLAGVEALVYDESMEPRPLGEEGELYVSGPVLALGYLNQPDLTAQRFPVHGGKRMYKTGDRARVLPNRDLEILGRCDSMQKIRGYSVELSAIEAAILALTKMVSSCAVIVQGEEGTDKFVVGYVVMQKDKEGKSASTCKKVRIELKAKLPHYMVPAFLIEMDELPKHAVSGKLDKKALPKVDPKTGRREDEPAGRSRSASTELDCTMPRTELEATLHDLWCEVMTLQQIDVVVDSFFDLGGHSLLAAKLVAEISEKVGKPVGVVDLFGHSTIEALAVFLGDPEHPDANAAGVAAMAAPVDFAAEVKYFDPSSVVNDIAMRAFWRSTNYTMVRARSAMITGATGFLGSFLLYELLTTGEMDVVYCIVRPSTDDTLSVRDRVRLALENRGLWRDDFEARIEAFSGDASLHHLGLQDDEYAMLCTGVDLIVHCAAMVNLVYPYKGLRAANVQGTRNVIELALSGKVKPLAYVSTNGIFPDGMVNCSEEADISQLVENGGLDLASGYTQSKWVAEQLVRHASDNGLPTIIFRPGNMGGDSGLYGGGRAWNASDLNYLVLTGSIKLGAAPDVPGWIMEMTPVDVAAHAMGRILFDKASVGKTYHVTNFAGSLQANEYFDVLRGAGYRLAKLSFDEWKAALEENTDPSLSKLRSALIGASAQGMQKLSTFDNSVFVQKCAENGIALPVVSSGVMSDYLESWQQCGAVPEPLHNSGSRLLHGKIALVTGASSGIGSAIASALAEAGASVGIGGRRLDRLESLADQIRKRTGASVFPYSVDVTQRQQVKDFVTKSQEAFGGKGVDIFVNNAGVMHYTRMEHMKEDQWEKEVDVNCKGLLHGIGAVLPGMIARKSGHIIATSSDAGRKTFPGLSVYSGSKFFVESVCQGLRLETADQGLKVTTIQPGDCKTELSGLTTDEEARKEFAQASDARELWLDPQDVARAVLFAATAPAHVGINEVLIEPRGAPA